MLPDFVHERKIPKLKRDWEGLKVKTLRDISTSQMIIPTGTICTVERNYGGLFMHSDQCELCGVSMKVIKVLERDVELISSRCHECKVPMHADENSESIDELRGTYQCWNCGFRGNLEE